MNLLSRASRIALALTALALPLKASGCGRTACITVTAAQLVNGSCPSAAAAQARFSDPGCSGNVESVDSDGALSGSLCCYSVTLQDSGNESFDCGTGGSFGDTSFEASTGTGFGGDGVGGGSSCGTGVTCQDALDGVPFMQVCSDSLQLLMTLQMCACNGGCMSICDPNLCIGNAPDSGCFSCLQTSCANELAACQQD